MHMQKAPTIEYDYNRIWRHMCIRSAVESTVGFLDASGLSGSALQHQVWCQQFTWSFAPVSPLSRLCSQSQSLAIGFWSAEQEEDQVTVRHLTWTQKGKKKKSLLILNSFQLWQELQKQYFYNVVKKKKCTWLSNIVYKGLLVNSKKKGEKEWQTSNGWMDGWRSCTWVFAKQITKWGINEDSVFLLLWSLNKSLPCQLQASM